jgi:hypothetical protein
MSVNLRHARARRWKSDSKKASASYIRFERVPVWASAARRELNPPPRRRLVHREL